MTFCRSIFSFLLFFFSLSDLQHKAFAVDRSKFRKCSNTAFCRRFRSSSEVWSQSSKAAKWLIEPSHIEHEGKNGNSAKELKARLTGPPGSPPLNLQIGVYETGTFRVRITEDKDRWQPDGILQALSPSSYQLLNQGDERIPQSVNTNDDLARLALLAAPSSSGEPHKVLVLYFSPLKVELYVGGVLQVTVNDRSLMHFEWQRSRSSPGGGSNNGDSKADRHGGKEVTDYGEDGLAIYADGSREEKVAMAEDGGSTRDSSRDEDWEESFGGHTDSKPRGPMSVGIDFSFPAAQHLYGIPEHTSPLSLPSTIQGSAGIPNKYNEPYRLYNLDVFEYEIDETMALYGHIPFMVGHGLVEGRGQSTGVFWFNPSETFIDISDGSPSAVAGRSYSRGVQSTIKESHWLSESGNIDFFLFPGPTPKHVFDQYTRVTGRQQLPPMFSLGYHQCRWNYKDERDVAAVEGMFEQLDYPVDVIWLDIEHTDGKRYFTWDKNVFPNPIEMQQNVSRHGRRMVTIIDPHLKRDDGYHIHREATQKGLYIKSKSGDDFDGWCWPGSSSYLDFTDPNVRTWWAQQFALDKYKGSTLDLFTWNDMNEPSVFNGPEVSMPKDAKNLAGVEHREWHNLYGLYMQQATGLGLTTRAKGLIPSGTALPRPFVLSRAFWAGSQKYGAIWTGDNKADWSHLEIASPMLLSINLAGLSFAGADVGGFFGEPGAELFTRWYQAGAFTPFFRGHAHHDTKRREPWVFGEPYTSILRSVAMVRYSLLPLWYTVFFEAYSTGQPVMRTMFSEFPDDPKTFAMDGQWMVGDSLLVSPVIQSGADKTDVYLPLSGSDGSSLIWYDLTTLAVIAGSANPRSVQAPLSSIPVFIKGGKIVPRKMRLRRSSKLMFFDPLTLIVAPDMSGRAEGELYMDDETTLAHEISGAFALRTFTFTTSGSSSAILSCSRSSRAPPTAQYSAPNTLERVVIAGQSRGAKTVVLKTAEKGDIELVHFFDPNSGSITLKKPDVLVTADWSIQLIF